MKIFELINLFASNHTHHQWQSTIANAVEEAVVEELLPYKELFTTVVNHEAAATHCFRVYCSYHLLQTSPSTNAMNSNAKPMNSIVDKTNFTAKVT